MPTVQPPTVPCAPWTTPELVRACCNGLLPDQDLTAAIQFVSAVLFRLSGRQFTGACQRTIWKCQGDTTCGLGREPTWDRYAEAGWVGTPSMPYRSGDGWSNDWGGVCGGSCHLPCVELPGAISDIIEVVVHGEVLSPDAYRVDGQRRLCRVDGGTWPCSNSYGDPYSDPVFGLTVHATGGAYTLRVTVNGVVHDVAVAAIASDAVVEASLNAALGQGAASVTGGPGGTAPYLVTLDSRRLHGVATMSVQFPALTGDLGVAFVDVIDPGSAPPADGWYITWLTGRGIPPDATFAASIFACQVALARCGSSDCVLPARLKDIAREDVSMTFADPLEFIGSGQVGIYEVDLWLQGVNPHKLARRASVHRADAPPRPRRLS